ncbi:FtsW/RodA/SpoVE family cell cycle protein [Agrilactobacillus fermenti]|uniref:FtsW/RodA/SpoVE family cell cycle protein n=1 Tax=Agrilactobacillus fermenti TaxID=2586909 RepID=UPI001E657513|nr:FtsW/RodA/SpoVE family cell cycle protein [Agrilactobacillus fermenti]MCD2255267.1 FtsW/RodA/SpoVE family cell cycle protein [Agrilactobacillus fermenti]
MHKKFSYLDYYILVPFLLLIGAGVVMIYSASSDMLAVAGADPTIYLKRQFFWVIVALVITTIVFLSKIDIWRSDRLIKGLLIMTLILLVYLVVLSIVHPAAAVNGAVAWINLGPINIQPTEIAKLTIILYFAFIFNKRGPKLSHGQIWHNLFGPIILAGVITGLVLIQPDTGGASILAFIAAIMIFSAGIPIGWGLSFVTLLGAFIPLGINLLKKFPLPFLEHSYQYQRILSFLYPFQRERAGGSQLVNSYFAINNGGWLGRGLGNSIQKKGYLPVPYTDFILSVIAEELGVIGVAVILGLLFFLIGRIIYVGIRAHSTYRTLICYGVAAMMFVQASFNIAGVIGFLPITGVTLPFISYGGSSIVTLSIAIGLVLNISSTEKRERAARSKKAQH